MIPRDQAIAGAASGLFGATAVALAATTSDPFGPAAVLGLAAVVGAGSFTAVALGVLAVVVAAGTPPLALTASPWWLAALSGVALGLVARAVDPAIAALASSGRRAATGILLSLAVALTFALPDAVAWLATPEGEPWYLHAVVRDATTGGRTTSELPALVAHRQLGGGLGAWLPWLAGLAAAGLMIWRAAAADALRRPAWSLVFAAGGGVALYGLLGLAELTVGGAVSVDLAELRYLLTLEAGPTYAIERLEGASAGALAPWSRPVVDGLRVLLGGLLAALALRALVHPTERGVARAVRPTAQVAFIALGFAFAAPAAVLGGGALGLAIGAGALLLLGALVVGRLGAPEDPAPTYYVPLAAAVWSLSLAAAAAGWIAP